MKVNLDYGSDGLEVELPDGRTTVIEPAYPKGVADPARTLRAALDAPVSSESLETLTKGGGKRIAISVCDGTRPQPRPMMLRALFQAMPDVRPDDVVILIATGTHRANRDDELRAMLGDDIVNRYRVHNHDARDPHALASAGTTPSGVPILLNREWLDADFRITTGFVEPHFFAGFSGGPKMVAPGLAGLETTMVLHDAAHVGHDQATWGVIHGNPIHDDVREIAAATGVDFAFDVTLNGDKEITAAFAGELFSEHAIACETSRREAMRRVDEPFDVVVTTNSGFPLDQNLYQAIKGMSAAAKVVKPGGTILCAAECRDGLPAHGAYAELLTRAASTDELLSMVKAPGFSVPDQWQVQVQAMIQSKARVRVKTSFLSSEDLRKAHFDPVDDVGRAAREALDEAGSESTLCALPRGPRTIPYVS